MLKLWTQEKKIWIKKDQGRTMAILSAKERIILWPLNKEQDNLKNICLRFLFFNNSLVIHLHWNSVLWIHNKVSLKLYIILRFFNTIKDLCQTVTGTVRQIPHWKIIFSLKHSRKSLFSEKSQVPAYKFIMGELGII